MRLTELNTGAWLLEIAPEETMIGYDGENNAPFSVVQTSLSGFDFYFHIQYSNGTKAVLPVALRNGTLEANWTAAYILPGNGMIQIVGRSGNTVRKSNLVPVRFGASVNAEDQLAPVAPDVWAAYLAQVAALRDEAVEAAQSGGGSGSGVSAVMRNTLVNIMQSALFATPDIAADAEAFLEAWGGDSPTPPGPDQPDPMRIDVADGVMTVTGLRNTNIEYSDGTMTVGGA